MTDFANFYSRLHACNHDNNYDVYSRNHARIADIGSPNKAIYRGVRVVQYYRLDRATSHIKAAESAVAALK